MLSVRQWLVPQRVCKLLARSNGDPLNALEFSTLMVVKVGVRDLQRVPFDAWPVGCWPSVFQRDGKPSLQLGMRIVVDASLQR